MNVQDECGRDTGDRRYRGALEVKPGDSITVRVRLARVAAQDGFQAKVQVREGG